MTDSLSKSSGSTPPTDYIDRRDRAVHALCRFVFPGHLVPRLAMAEAVLAALDHGDDYIDHLPAKRICERDEDDG